MIAIALLLAGTLAGLPAPAQDDQPLSVRVGEAVAATGVYQAPSAEVDGDALRAVAETHPGFGFVVLSGEPVGASIDFADDVLDVADRAAPAVHTVVVVSPTDYGAVSERYSDEAIDAAFEAVLPTLRRNRVAGLDDFADEVPTAGPALAGDETASASEDDGSSFPIGWVVLLALVAGGAWAFSYLTGNGSGDSADTGDGGSGSWWSSSRRPSWSSRRSFSSSSASRSSRRSSSSSSSSSRRGRGGGRF